MIKNDRLATVYALAAVLMWSTVATAFKLGLQELSLLQLLTGASFVSLLVLALFLLYKGQLLLAFESFFSHWKITVVLGLLNPVLYYIILFKAYDLLPAQIAQSLNYTWAITLTLLSVPLLKHKITRRDIIAVILGYTGVICIVFSSKKIMGDIQVLGIFLALISTLIWAVYWLINVKDKRPPIIKLFQSFLIAFPVLLVITIFFDDIGVFTSINPWLYVLYIGLFEMGLAFIMWQLAMQLTTRVGKIGTLIFLSPVLSLFIIYHVLNEPIENLTIYGLIMILVGIGIQQLLPQKTPVNK